MAWHLAALGVASDEELAALPEVALAQFRGGHLQFVELRSFYLKRISNPAETTRSVVRLVRPIAGAM